MCHNFKDLSELNWRKNSYWGEMVNTWSRFQGMSGEIGVDLNCSRQCKSALPSHRSLLPKLRVPPYLYVLHTLSHLLPVHLGQWKHRDYFCKFLTKYERFLEAIFADRRAHPDLHLHFEPRIDPTMNRWDDNESSKFQNMTKIARKTFHIVLVHDCTVWLYNESKG